MPNQTVLITLSLSMLLLAGFLLILGSDGECKMSKISADKEESVKVVEAVIEVLKKEFPEQASTIIRDIIRIQVNI